MLIKTEAIVLRSLKYGDNRLIVDLLTEAEGPVGIVMTMPKTQKGKLKRQLFQPLTILSVEIDMRPNQQLQHLRDARISAPFSSIPFRSDKLGIALFVAEFLCYTSRGEHSDSWFFTYVKHSILWLDSCDSAYANFHLIMMLRVSKFLGIMPNGEDYSRGDYFDMRSGCFSHSAPMHPDMLSPDEAAQFERLLRMNYESMWMLLLNRDERNRITDTILSYYRLHVPAFPEMKSLEVLRELWV